jgi:hypothetical protein
MDMRWLSAQSEWLSQSVILQRGIACPHTANRTLETIWNLKFDLLEHLPYSPDLTPGDFLMFGPLEVAIRGVDVSNGKVKNLCFARKHKRFIFSGMLDHVHWKRGRHTVYFMSLFHIWVVAYCCCLLTDLCILVNIRWDNPSIWISQYSGKESVMFRSHLITVQLI